LAVGLVWAVLSPEQDAQLGKGLAGVWPVALLALLPMVGLSVWFWREHDRRHSLGPDRLLEKAKLLSAASQSQQIDVRAESTALQRLGEAINALAAQHEGGCIAVVCHGGVINAYLAEMLGTKRSLWMMVENTSITTVKLSETPSVLTLNDCSHLYDLLLQ
jgi:broad specificity phosphatase PhoE